MSRFALVFLFIFSISGVYALNMEISPANLDFDLDLGELVCKNVSVKSDYFGFIIGEDYWSNTASKDIGDYVFESPDGLEIDYSKELQGLGESKVCIYSENPGKYDGVLVYSLEDSRLGVGTWLNVSVSGNEKLEIFEKISGENREFVSIVFFGFISLFLEGTLVFLLSILYYQKRFI